MKEPYAEGLATHSDPESCGRAREDVSEALTGARTGWLLSREDTSFRVPRVWDFTEGKTIRPAKARDGGPGAVEDPMHVRKHLVREPGDPVSAPGRMASGAAARSPRTSCVDERSREV